MDSQEDIERKNRRRRNIMAGLGVAGVAASSIGAHGTIKAMVGITNLEKGSTGRLLSSGALTTIGAAAVLKSRESLREPYKHDETQQQYT